MTEQINFAGKFHLWFNIVMIILYALAGMLLLLFLHFDSLPALNTKMIGGVLLLYAVYRGYKLYKSYAVRKPPDQKHANQ